MSGSEIAWIHGTVEANAEGKREHQQRWKIVDKINQVHLEKLLD
jgi:hypothetical protein